MKRVLIMCLVALFATSSVFAGVINLGDSKATCEKEWTENGFSLSWNRAKTVLTAVAPEGVKCTAMFGEEGTCIVIRVENKTGFYIVELHKNKSTAVSNLERLMLKHASTWRDDSSFDGESIYRYKEDGATFKVEYGYLKKGDEFEGETVTYPKYFLLVKLESLF